ncbi:hypothetical protein [Thiocapsa roseopersicina]|uniref:Uncharacterized protein n=1 Tax=Thiocapsa roseopersicina TaxID=1058 RepID=A0A1H3ANR7_THIRO|nr:hypothetical protein [Thiocapsa roseopersicina]SDX31235.1 hypothetical protein SAMN05421783_12087 [Thiocapsa roseopersicina]
MPEIPGFWDIGPHDPLPVEATWTDFITSAGGKRVSELLSKSPDFDNADYLFEDIGAVLELKEIETEFLRTEAAQCGFEALLARLVKEDPTWRPLLFGGDGQYPAWFSTEFVRLARPALLRVLKKANRQIRETKEFFRVKKPYGTLIFVNDGFTGMAPVLVHALACDALVHSYSSIDCFLYVTVNRYLEITGSNEPKLIWNPTYSDRATDEFVQFIDDLGRMWFSFLDQKIGPFTSRLETGDRSALSRSKAIILPHEDRSPRRVELR